MKTLYYDAYTYLGRKDGWHVFECSKKDFDKEILLLERARVIQADGSSIYYDPIRPSESLTFDVEDDDSRRIRRLRAYSHAISKATSVKVAPHRRHIPKEMTPDLTNRSKHHHIG